ncbi:MAG TPA: hypothetical protein VFA44_15960 [Gaiellaceae bacterium]|nr:hypothetical protein [Gaiellaceae bacterium]
MQRRRRTFAAAGLVACGALALTGLALAGNPKKSKMMSANTGAKIHILAPKPGQLITGNAVLTDVAISHFKIDCALAGTAPKMGVGHYHIDLDGALVNMFCGPKASVSLANVNPGRHTLEFKAAENNHMEDMHSAQKVSFVYRPTHPLLIKPRTFAGAPSITIVSPKSGSTVSGGFNLVVAVKNFIPSCALYGKPDVAGYGHWHAFVDTTKGGAMGMGTMLGMSCAKSFHVSLAGIKPGVHTFFAQLEDDAHMPTIKGHSVAEVTLTVK